MTAYLLLGAGITLVLISVAYTYHVDRTVNHNKADHPVTESITYRRPTPTPVPANREAKKTAQVTESITNISDDLDELIVELKEKEIEVKEMVRRVKGWQKELNEEPSFAEILEKKMNINDMVKISSAAIASRAEDESFSAAKEALLSPNLKNAEQDFPKYEKIAKLLEEGLSAEEIARRLNLGYREVELVAKLRKKGEKAGA